MAPKKFYAVRVGKAPGLYLSWNECKAQTHGYPNAQFKAFLTESEAQAYLEGGQKSLASSNAEEYHIYVDGSFNQKQNKYSWAFVVLKQEEVLFQDSGVGENEEAALMRNVAGELAAAMRAIQWAEKEDRKPIRLHHDYMGIGAWATGAWKANNKFTQAYKNFTANKLDWIFFEKVKGHSGVLGNELADQLAGQALGKE
ncbi:MAG: ribonuclease H family protein [Sporomusaceae bacterium]|nr:ribonuclease H family protein [Sporomusaceae bacterium]